jgi:hypothetical protein
VEPETPKNLETDPEFRLRPARHPLSLNAPPTRREVLLFGLVILGLAYLTLGPRPRIVHVVPEPTAWQHALT